MFANFKFASLVLLVAVLGVQAQSAPPNSTGLSECATDCLNTAARVSDCSITDLSCVCDSQPFQTAAAGCLQSQCTQADQQDVLSLQAQECGESSGSAAPTPSATGAASSTSSATSSVQSVANHASSTGSSVSSKATSSSGPSGSVSVSVSSPSGSASQTGNAAFAVAPLSIDGIVCLVVSGVAAVAGAGFVL